MTENINTVETRRAYRRGQRLWIPVAMLAVVAVTGMALRAEGHGRDRGAGIRRGAGGEARNLADMAARLRGHAFWAAGIGLSGDDVRRLADVLDERSDLFAAFQERQASLTEQITSAISAETIDPDVLLAIRGDARQLATEFVDEGLILIVRAAEGLAPEQRARLLREWGER